MKEHGKLVDDCEEGYIFNKDGELVPGTITEASPSENKRIAKTQVVLFKTVYLLEYNNYELF